jgi:hypothetical protein
MNLNGLMRLFTIRVRMIGAIGVVVSLLCIVGVLALAGMQRMQSGSDRFIDTVFAANMRVSQVREALGSVRAAEKDLIARISTIEAPEAAGKWRNALQLSQSKVKALLEVRSELVTDPSLQGFER